MMVSNNQSCWKSADLTVMLNVLLGFAALVMIALILLTDSYVTVIPPVYSAVTLAIVAGFHFLIIYPSWYSNPHSQDVNVAISFLADGMIGAILATTAYTLYFGTGVSWNDLRNDLKNYFSDEFLDNVNSSIDLVFLTVISVLSKFFAYTGQFSRKYPVANNFCYVISYVATTLFVGIGAAVIFALGLPAISSDLAWFSSETSAPLQFLTVIARFIAPLVILLSFIRTANIKMINLAFFLIFLFQAAIVVCFALDEYVFSTPQIFLMNVPADQFHCIFIFWVVTTILTAISYLLSVFGYPVPAALAKMSAITTARNPRLPPTIVSPV